jgi:histidinol dehydrogenase
MQAKIINYKNKNFSAQINNILQQNSVVNHDLQARVVSIIDQVKQLGDQAIIAICNQFDSADFKKADDLLVSSREIQLAKKNLDPKLLAALKTAYKRIYSYHKKQLPKNFLYKDEIGVALGNKWQPIEKVAVYVPGGTAIYPSSVLMGAVPALVAGVKNIVMAVPSNAGKIADSVLVAADLCGIKTIYKMGGAAAIAALALGTDRVKKVDKIIGPGNSYVALAKKQLFGEVGIDMVAGPTDILIIADNKINPTWVAADMLSQLEHGVDSKAVLITDDLKFANLVNDALAKLTPQLLRREIIEKSLSENGLIIIVENLAKDGSEIANLFAPEHLEIATSKPELIAKKITNAGAIFMGKYSPEAIGDYIAGPSHTLPTMGTARFSSGLSVFDFLKRISIISCSKKGFDKLKDQTALLADNEGLTAHKLSITIRK